MSSPERSFFFPIQNHIPLDAVSSLWGEMFPSQIIGSISPFPTQPAGWKIFENSGILWYDKKRIFIFIQEI